MLLTAAIDLYASIEGPIMLLEQLCHSSLHITLYITPHKSFYAGTTFMGLLLWNNRMLINSYCKTSKVTLKSSTLNNNIEIIQSCHLNVIVLMEKS